MSSSAGGKVAHMTGLDFLPNDQRRLFIGGQWTDAGGGRASTCSTPRTGPSCAPVADATVADGQRALEAAVAAQDDWAATPPRDRGEILRRAFELVAARSEQFAELMSLEMGKTLKEAKGEVTYGNEFLRWFSEEAVRIHGRWMQAPAGGSRLLTIKKPVGPCLFVTPWNFPLAMGTRKIGPAVAAGCTMVVKPAQQTPLTMLALAATFAEAGLPDGVLNVVTTTHAGDVSAAIMADERLRKVSFTGSTGIGKQLVKQSADQLQRVSMELGGNAPFLVFDDADLDAAVDGAMLAKMRNMGEACTAANRFLVHSSVADEFAKRLADRMGALTVGRGQDEGVDVGPLIDEKAVESVTQLVDGAVSDGAKVVVGGQAHGGPGFFYPPTVLVDVPPDAAINREEIFGPVAPITTFETEEEAVAQANDTEYGLASYVYTRDLAADHPAGRGARLRHGRRQHRAGLQRGGAVRRRQGQRLRPRGWLRGDRGVPRHDVRRAGCSELLRWSRTAGCAAQYVEFAGALRGRVRRASSSGRCGVAADDEVLAWVDQLPGLKKQPNIVFAAARWHGVPAPGPYAGLRDALLRDDGTIRATILARSTQTNEVGRLATLLPAFASLVPSGPVALHRGGRERRAQPLPGPVGLRVVDAERRRSELGPEPYLPCEVTRTGTAADRRCPRSPGGAASTSTRSTSPTPTRCAGSRTWSGPRRTTAAGGCGTRSTIARADPPRPGPRRPARRAARARRRGGGGTATVVVFHSAVAAYLPAERPRPVPGPDDAAWSPRAACHWVSNEAPNVLPDVTATAPGRRRGRPALRARRRRPDGRADPRPREVPALAGVTLAGSTGLTSRAREVVRWSACTRSVYHTFGAPDDLVLDELPDLEPGPPARSGSPSGRPACTCSTPRCAAASRARSRRRSCPRSPAARSPASSTGSAAGRRRGLAGPRGAWRTSARCPAGTPSRRSPRRQPVPGARPRRRSPTRWPRVGTGRTALGVLELEPPRRRRGARAVGGGRARLAAGAGGAGGRCDRWSPRPAARRTAQLAELGADLVVDYDERGWEEQVRERRRRRHPRLRRRGRRGRAAGPGAAGPGRPAGDVRVLVGDADPVRHRRPGRSRDHVRAGASARG